MTSFVARTRASADFTPAGRARACRWLFYAYLAHAQGGGECRGRGWVLRGLACTCALCVCRSGGEWG